MDMPKIQNHRLTPGKKKPVSEFSDTGYMRRVISNNGRLDPGDFVKCR